MSERLVKGTRTELKFKEWLDRNEIPYFYFQQDSDSFSKTLKYTFEGKRPDFMILLPYFGFIFVDVKYRKYYETYNSFPLDALETKKLSRLQRIFNLSTWFVLSNENYSFDTWFWIPVSQVLEEGINPTFKSSKSQEDFFAVPLDKFIKIGRDDTMAKLFSNPVKSKVYKG